MKLPVPVYRLSLNKQEISVNRVIIYSAFAAIFAAVTLHAEDTLPLKSVNKANEIIDAALEAHGGAELLTNL